MLKPSVTTGQNSLGKISQEKLMRLIPFNEDDLAANDDGYFTDAQKMRLKPKTDLYIALSSIGAFMGFVVALICFYVGNKSENNVYLTGVFIAVFGICFIGIAWAMSLANQIKRGFGVKKAEGNAELFITYSGEDEDIPNYKLQIGGVGFDLSREVYEAFESGKYRVYYFRLLRNEMLSVEPVG
jgi:hypothetical protein